MVLLSCPSPPSVRSSSPSILHAFHSRLSLCCPICLASFLRSEKKERSILASIPVPPCIPFPVFSLALQIQKLIQPYHLFLPPSFIPCILPSSASLPFLPYIHVPSFHRSPFLSYIPPVHSLHISYVFFDFGLHAHMTDIMRKPS